jgi:zinc transporter 1/2/3
VIAPFSEAWKLAYKSTRVFVKTKLSYHLIKMAEVEIAAEIICNAREDLSNYDLPLHIGSIFILVGASILGSLSPVLYASFGNGSIKSSINSQFVIRLGLLFGAGVILSTGFIHMFVAISNTRFIPAVLLLTDPCLAEVWNDEYPSFAGICFFLISRTICDASYLCNAAHSICLGLLLSKISSKNRP